MPNFAAIFAAAAAATRSSSSFCAAAAAAASASARCCARTFSIAFCLSTADGSSRSGSGAFTPALSRMKFWRRMLLITTKLPAASSVSLILRCSHAACTSPSSMSSIASTYSSGVKAAAPSAAAGSSPSRSLFVRLCRLETVRFSTASAASVPASPAWASPSRTSASLSCSVTCMSCSSIPPAADLTSASSAAIRFSCTAFSSFSLVSCWRAISSETIALVVFHFSARTAPLLSFRAADAISFSFASSSSRFFCSSASRCSITCLLAPLCPAALALFVSSVLRAFRI